MANEEKLLSLFEPDIHVIVRGKAGEEVEFGNLLVSGEQSDGLIIDWELFKEEVPADVRLVRPSVERVEDGLRLSVSLPLPTPFPRSPLLYDLSLFTSSWRDIC